MWNLLKWISSPSKKEEEAAMRAARHHAREKRDGISTGKQSEGNTSSNFNAPAKHGAPTAASLSETNNTISSAAGANPAVQADPDHEHNKSAKSVKDVFSSAKTPDIAGVRRNAMAYWRKNTNAERPGDLHYYTNLTSPAGSNWQNPFMADAASSTKKQAIRAAAPASDLSSLAAFITSNSKNYLAGMHARKSQNELQGQEFESFQSGENLNSAPPDDFAAYPHYKGGWEAEGTYVPYRINSVGNFEPLSEPSSKQADIKDAEVVPECGIEEIIADEAVAQTLAAQSAQSGSLFIAASDALCHHMNISFAPAVEATTAESPTVCNDEQLKDLRTNHAWTVSPVTGSPVEFEAPQTIAQELTDSLSSLESSPQCDLLFEQSAAAAGAIFPGAKPMRPLDSWLTPACSSDDMRLMESINDSAFDESVNDLRTESANGAPSIPFQMQSQAEQSTTLDNLPEQQFVDVRISAADNFDTSPEILRALAYDINPDVRFAIAENHNVDQEILSILAADENPYVAHRARKTLQRLEGGQLKQGKFVQAKNSDKLPDRRKSL